MAFLLVRSEENLAAVVVAEFDAVEVDGVPRLEVVGDLELAGAHASAKGARANGARIEACRRAGVVVVQTARCAGRCGLRGHVVPPGHA